MATILMPIPNRGFDPTEAGVPWRLMHSRGHRVAFATPDGNQGQADPTLITGKELGLLGRFMMADANGRLAYEEMTQAADFRCPIRYDAIQSQDFDALLLPGGHAPGMRPYLEIGAAADGRRRLLSRRQAGRRHLSRGPAVCASLRSGSQVSPLRKENNGPYQNHGTSGPTVHSSSSSPLSSNLCDERRRGSSGGAREPRRLHQGPLQRPPRLLGKLRLGFTVRDGNYLSARWAGDAHRFTADFADILGGRS